MAAPVAILAKPDDHRGILKMSEAVVDAMLEAFLPFLRVALYRVLFFLVVIIPQRRLLLCAPE
ncbi:MAG TPA: hypothetical protein VGW77_25275 [Candidatus Binatia bacterium]|jgi:hypothetical protein|nr:hypothetical protein [Candidatus Binatia bacterium]